MIVSFLDLRDRRQLANLPNDKYAKLRTYLKGVLVRVQHRPEARPKPIADLVPQAGLQEFDKEGERWTVRVSRSLVSSLGAVCDDTCGVVLLIAAFPVQVESDCAESRVCGRAHRTDVHCASRVLHCRAWAGVQTEAACGCPAEIHRTRCAGAESTPTGHRSGH